MSAPVDLLLGVGYRVPMGPSDKVATGGVDLHLGVDIGQFKSFEHRTVSGDTGGDIAGDKQALHVAVGIGLGYHFAP